MTKIENTFTGETEKFTTMTVAFEAIDGKANAEHWTVIDGITGGEIKRYHGMYDKSEWVFALVEMPGVEHILRGEK